MSQKGYSLLGSDVVYSDRSSQLFWRNLLLTSSDLKTKPSKEAGRKQCKSYSTFFCLLVPRSVNSSVPDDGDRICL